MASKLLFFQMILIGSLVKGALSLPAIHVINGVNGNYPPIEIQVRAGGYLKSSALLKPRQSYKFDVDLNDVYYASAQFSFKFAEFHPYEPARDVDRVAVYWKADMDGFAISYDNLNWNKVASWVVYPG